MLFRTLCGKAPMAPSRPPVLPPRPGVPAESQRGVATHLALTLHAACTPRTRTIPTPRRLRPTTAACLVGATTPLSTQKRCHIPCPL